MKKFVLGLMILLVFSINKLKAQDYNVYIKNDHLISPTILEFDVYIEATSADLILEGIQFGIQFDAAFISAMSTITGIGETPSYGFPISSSELNYQSGGLPQWNSTYRCLSVPLGLCYLPNSGPCGHALLTTALGPKRVATFRLTSSLPFVCAPSNISFIRPADSPPMPTILRTTIIKNDPITCNNSVPFNGTFTNFLSNTLYGNVNNMKPLFSTQPLATSACTGIGSATFSVIANNGTSSPVNYQWLENGIPLTNVAPYSGTQTSTLNITLPSASLNGKLYSCFVTQCGLSNISTQGMLTVNNFSSLYISSSANPVICPGSNVTLTAHGGGTYLWSTGATSPSINVTNPVNYTVSSPGCASSQPFVVSNYGLPTITISSNDTICTGNTINLNSSGGVSYSWTGPNSFASTLPNPSISNATPTNSGTYTVTVVDQNGCSNSESTSISVTGASVFLSPDNWISRTAFGGSARSEAVAFTIGAKGFVGTGNGNDFWEFTPNNGNGVWTQKASMPAPGRTDACGFSIGDKGYIGCGGPFGGGNNTYYNDFWEYNLSSNSWTAKANFGVACRNATGFSIGNKGYILAGRTGSGVYSSMFMEYDPDNDTWTLKSNYPGGVRQSACSFVIDNTAYVGSGEVNGTYKFDFYKYNPQSNNWQSISNFTGAARANCVAFSIGNRGYVATGSNSSNSYRDLYEYNSEANSWLQKANLIGNNQGREGAVAFAINGFGYLGTGNRNGNLQNDFFRYEPAPSITTGALSASVLCRGDTIEIPYSIGGTFQCDNSFIAQLSDANGNFTTPANIGIKLSTIAGMINAIIPSNITTGNLYRIRVISTNPLVVGSDNKTNLTINNCDAILQLKVFIEGFYNAPGIMNASINPVTLPNVADSITAELHDFFPPYDLQFSSKNILFTNGIGNFPFKHQVIGNPYYIVIRHRNGLETWSSEPQFISQNTNYDFSISQDKAFGNNLKNVGNGNYAIYSGDIADALQGIGFQDGIIESTDYLEMENAVSVLLSGYSYQDITGDNVVEATDYLIMENNVSSLIFRIRP